MQSVVAASLVLTVAGETCPAGWSQDTLCYWPHQKQYANFTVDAQQTAAEKAAACCTACAADHRCQQWTLHTEAGSQQQLTNVCILNQALIEGNAPQDPSSGCRSGKAPICREGCPSNPAPPAKAPKGAKNVLFFAVDDLRPEIEIFGGVPGTPSPKMHTPHMEALASKSLVLAKNYVQQAVCSPTRQSLLTGRRPDRTRVYDLYSYFRDVAANYTTIPQWFRMHGYNMSGTGKIFHPGHAAGRDTVGGDNDYCCSWGLDNEYFFPDDNSSKKYAASWLALDEAAISADPPADFQSADHAVELLDTLQATRASGDSRPFFMAVGFHRPHLPFVVAEEYLELYPMESIELPYDQQPPKDLPRVAWSNWDELRQYDDQAECAAHANITGQPGEVLPEEDVLALRRAYYAAVSQTDALLGKVLNALERSGEAANTVIAFWGDHGWQLGEHGEWAKHTNFEFATRAPMMVSVPGLTDNGIVTQHYSEHVDLFPTLTEAAAGVALPRCPAGDASFEVAECTEGSSLVPIMHDPSSPVKTAAFSQYPRAYQHNSDDLNDAPNPQMSPCIRDGVQGCTMGYTLVTTVQGHEYRYTEWADFNTPGFKQRVNWDRIVGVELYNHSASPGENENLISEGHTSLVAQLSKMLHAGPEAAMLSSQAVVV